MSQKWRNQHRRPAVNVDAIPQENSEEYGDVVEGYANYDPSPQVLAYYQGGNSPHIEAEPVYPGQREFFHTEESGYTPDNPNMDGQDNSTFNLIDREVGGQRGRIDVLPYSTSVTSSALVENHWLDGAQAVIRRQRNPSETGPVGTSDYNGSAALRFAMATNQYFPNEASQADLVRSI